MSQGRWSKERELFVRAMTSPFKYIPQTSNRSKSASGREYKLETLMSRVTRQIFECEDQGLPWRTPKDWDESREILGGSRSRRKSEVILERVRWETFLELADEILKSRT